MKEKTESKPKLDFSSKSGVVAAAEILKTEGFQVWDSFPGKKAGGVVFTLPTILFNGNENEGKKAWAFALDQDWPACELRRVWSNIPDDDEFDRPHWELEFKRKPV